jgi:imidazolonepropionase-like amidohydrolase
MKKIVALLCIGFIIIGCAQKKKVTADLAITNVTLIDGAGSKEQPNMTVLITNDSITGIEQSNKIKLDANTKVIEGKGKFLIPGLWDMHVHASNDTNFCSLVIANGVTSVREMFATRQSFRFQIDWRNKVNADQIVGPHMYIPLAVMGPDQNWFSSIQIATVQQARQFVKEVKDSGADFIKVFDLYNPKVIMAVLMEAKEQGIRVAGHCPLCLNIADAAEAGLGSFEHTLGILGSASSKEAIIRSAMMKEAKRVHNSFSDEARLLFFYQSKDYLPTYDSIKAAQLFRRLKESGSYQCPTLAAYLGKVKAINSDFSIDGRSKYVAKECLESWKGLKQNPFSASITPADYEQVRAMVRNKSDLVPEFKKYGIPILAGTDAGSGCTHHYLVPGFSLHDELRFLVEASLTPMEALQAATKNAANSLGVLNKTGTIEAGKCADLVLLDADPLLDINNTRKINAVVKNGNYYSREKLDSILKTVEKRVNP